MLRELMRMMAEGQVGSEAELANRLGVSAGLVEQMLEDLTRKGYLNRFGDLCVAGCKACPLSGRCGGEPAIKGWILTEKGRKAARLAGESRGVLLT